MATSKTHSTGKSWLDPWHVNPSTNRDYDFIDGLRGVAMLMVLVGHYLYFNPNAGKLVTVVGSLVGELGSGVIVFFALSGFLISWPFWKLKFTQSSHVVASGYGWRRFWKIYPPLALCVLLYTPIYICLNDDWSYVTLAFRWLVGIPFVMPESNKFDSVVWTLVVEVQFYIFLPLLFLCLRKTSPKVCFWVVSLIFLVLPGTVRAVTGLSAGVIPMINTHFPAGLDFFALGIILAGLENMGVMKKTGPLNQLWKTLPWIGLVLWPLALGVSAWLHHQPGGQTVAQKESVYAVEKFASGCLLCLVASPQTWLSRLLSMTWLRWCGIISYEWYLFHQPLMGWARETLGPANGNLPRYLLIVLGSLVVSVTLSASIYRYFSLPILKRGRSMAQSKPKTI